MKEFNMRAAYERIEEIQSRLSEMANVIEKENRSLNDAENAERINLERELNLKQMQITANTKIVNVNTREDMETADKQIREAVASGARYEFKVSRALNVSGYADPANSVNPGEVHMQEIVEPLYENSVLTELGVTLKTGLKGEQMYPVVEAFSATIEEEGVALGDTNIETSKLWAKPQRCAVAVPITRQALTETDNLLQTIFTQYAPAAAAELMNKILVSTSKVTNSTTLVGPFVAPGTTKTYSGDTPTKAELKALVSAVKKNKIKAQNLGYIMSEDLKGTLECTPRWEGSDLAIIEDNKIDGIPVVTAADCPDNTVEFGAFKYAPMAIFGDMSIIVDPYSQARKGAVDFILEFNLACTVLRDKAFAVLKKS